MRSPLALATSFALFVQSVPALAVCARDPVMPILRSDCRFGDQNIYFQVACQDLYRFSAMADNVDAGSRQALKDLEAEVEAAKAQPVPDQATSYGHARGIAMAGIQTGNLTLSATQIVLSKLISTEQAGQQALKDLAARNQEDAATLAYLQKQTDPALADRRTQDVATYQARVTNQAKAKSKLEDGLRLVAQKEKLLRQLRTDLVAFKNGSTKELAGLPSQDDKDYAAKEEARTQKLSTDEQGIFASIRTNCFENNGIRAGCARVLDGMNLFSMFFAVGRVFAMIRWVGMQALKKAFRDYFNDDSLKQLIICGQGKAFPVIDLTSDADLHGDAPKFAPGI